ncbi:MAG: hypothetical protein V4727_09010 [Verrucomicrobiota bacterium]
MSDSPKNPLEGLLDQFALGPAWARAKPAGTEKKFREPKESDLAPRRKDDRGGRDNRNQRDNRQGDRRDDRRQGGGNRRDFDKGGPRHEPQREEIVPAEGVNVTLLPDKTAIQLVCKEIHHVARVYPLFDVAEIILAERARCRAHFEISEKQPAFYRCKFEEAIFLTKEEALQYFLKADWRNQFIEESTIEIDPPKGSFQSVAKCGISGEWLGPPNYHAYQSEIRRIHRERFSHMPLESYMAKIRTERSEEAVNAWLDSMKLQTRWRILTAEDIQARDNPPQPADSPAPTPEETPAPTEESDESVQSEESDESPEALEDSPVSEESQEAPQETPAEPEETPAPASDIKWFTDRAEFERAIASELLDKAFKTTRKANVSAAISAKNLSPGLLARLKGTGNHIRKHAAILIPAVCKALEAEHMAVFKRKGKLFTGPARPSALALDAVLAPRPGEMVKWIRENPPAKLEGLWKAVLPEGATAPPAEYAADLFWLLQQGHILLYTDDTLVVQEPPKPPEPKKPKAPKKKAVAAIERSEMAGETTAEEIPANSLRPAKEKPSPETTDSLAEVTPEANVGEAVPEAAAEATPEVTVEATEDHSDLTEEPAPTPEEPDTSSPEN